MVFKITNKNKSSNKLLMTYHDGSEPGEEDAGVEVQSLVDYGSLLQVLRIQ